MRGIGVAPLLHLRAGFDVARKIILYFEGDGISLSGENGYDTAAKFMYRINPKWDVAAGWRWTGYDLDITEIKNEVQSSGWIMHAAYPF